MIAKKTNKKTLHKYAVSRVTYCETEPQDKELTNIVATLCSKTRATTLTGYKFTENFSEKKLHCSQVSNGNRKKLDHQSFYKNKFERLLLLNPEDCKN